MTPAIQYLGHYLLLAFLLCFYAGNAQRINSLETIGYINTALLKSEQEHLAYVKAVTLADSILNSDFNDITDLVKPELALVFPDTIGSDIGHQIIYDSNFGDLSIRFNSTFKIIKPFDYAIIPCYVYKDGRECKFISESEAISIAKKAFKHKKGVDLKAYHNFDYSRKKHQYTISKKINPKENKLEVIVVDAKTGKIISQKVRAYETHQNGVGTEFVNKVD